MSRYCTSTVKRRTKAEIAQLDAALVAIVQEIAPATVRQVFYQAVVRGLVPKDHTLGYRPVQGRLKALREAGVIPYNWITDNARMVRRRERYGSLQDFAQEIAQRYYVDYWRDSDVRMEVWLEKDALAGVLWPVLDQYGLELFVTRGFSSVSYLNEAAEFINRDGRDTFVYQLTDFDPAGLSIAETIKRELVRRTTVDDEWSPVRVERLAVTREQVDRWELPTRPTKASDPKARKFEAIHGTDSVELDSIAPDTLRGMVEERIQRHMDSDTLMNLKEQEQREREGLAQIEALIGGAADDS